MEKVIIYGAGNVGEQAYKCLKGTYDILFFVDKDGNKQGGKRYMGLDVYGPEKLADCRDTKVVIASVHREEILKEISQYQLKDVSTFQVNIIRNLGMKVQEELKYRTINLGALLAEQKSMRVGELTFIPGGSGVLDYALLPILAKMLEKKVYLEIGTYIGESINIMSEVCDKVYSVTADPDSSYGMRIWCRHYDIPHYSGRLVNDEKVTTFYMDSKEFDFSEIGKKVEIYFIDGDHSYNGVFQDTKNVFQNRREDSIVVWHDFKEQRNNYNANVVCAVRDAIGEKFENVYVFNNNMCGIYLPDKYQKFFELCEGRYEENAPLYTYDVSINAVDIK